jgi:hypothetical protein
VLLSETLAESEGVMTERERMRRRSDIELLAQLQREDHEVGGIAENAALEREVLTRIFAKIVLLMPSGEIGKKLKETGLWDGSYL